MSPIRALNRDIRKRVREQEAASKAAQRTSRNARAKEARERAAIERESA